MLETDYLVVGAGASGMAFVDSLITESEADVVLVDRRHRPGGHWLDAYPFVRLHQPSAFYGVNSMRLGQDRIEAHGPDAGFYERATKAEICAYYERVLAERFLPSGRVRFIGMSEVARDGNGEHSFRSLLTGVETPVRVRKALVDATYLEGEIPATHTPNFGVDEPNRLIPPNELVDAGESTGYTVVGSGKTGIDTCSWLLDNGVDPDRIRWVKPRELWGLNRAGLQPLDQVASVIEGVADDFEAVALAEDPRDLFRRLESCGRLIRVDRDVEPTMFRGATLSVGEVEPLRSIENVVRKGRLRRITSKDLVLDEGSVPAEPGHVYVDCTARGLVHAEPRPVFEPSRITVQTVRMGLTPFNAALIGYVEATRDDIDEKNRLTPAHPYMSAALDWVHSMEASTRADIIWGDEVDVSKWLERARLNPAMGIRKHFGDPRMQAALARLFEYRDRALERIPDLMKEGSTSWSRA